MIKTTRAQRESLWILFLRQLAGETICYPNYREMRKSVQPIICSDGAIAVSLWGMWIAIEADGHRHS